MKTLELPNDVIIEILSWAPADSLLRFQWVCKYWFDLITGPKFIKLHLLHHSTTSSTAATHEDHHHIIDNTFFLMLIHSQIVYSMRTMDVSNQYSSPPKTVKMDNHSTLFPISNCYEEFKVFGSCNGLIYFHHHFSTSHIGGYFLWNPCTRELRRLPQPSKPCIQSYKFCEFDPVHGFGYDHIIDDYKVVRVTYYYNLDEIEIYTSKVIDVYTLELNSWRTIENNPLDEYGSWNILHGPGLYVNGALHWIRKSPLELVTVTSFDISKEENQEIQLPNSVSTKPKPSYLSVLDECLCIFHMKDYVKGLVDLWMMKVYGVKESWTKLFTIDMIPLRMDFERLPWYYSNPLMYYSKDGGILIVFGREHIVAYDPKKKKKARCSDHINIADCHYRGGCVVASYVGSLVSLSSGKYLSTAAGSITKLTAKTRAVSGRRIRHDEENTKMKKQKISCSCST